MKAFFSDIRALERLLERNPVCYWTLDRDLRFRVVSPECALLFQRPLAELHGAKASEILSLDLQAIWIPRFRHVLAGESLTLMEPLARDHRQSMYSISLFPVPNGDGETLAMAGVGQDFSAPEMSKTLRSSALQMLQSQETVRTELAEFLHDRVAQFLGTAGLKLDLLRMDFEIQAPEIGHRIEQIQTLLEEIMKQVRDYSQELNPDLVARVGLRPALDRLIGRTRDCFKGTVRLVGDFTVRTPPAAACAMYRIAKEALENAVAHAGCSAIEVRIKKSSGRQILEVRDNGRGFDRAEIRGSRCGLGLLLMEKHAAEAGLRLSVETAPGEGTVVRASCVVEIEKRASRREVHAV